MKWQSRDAARAADAAAAAEEAEGMARFLRGLTLGALVGAAIAGSAIWQRARSQTERRIGRATRQTDHTTDTDARPLEGMDPS